MEAGEQHSMYDTGSILGMGEVRPYKREQTQLSYEAKGEK